jgi:asparagine synthase (glutamine-hydrolysing)
MRDALAHRGPDGVGNWLSPDATVGLAHRRLSIIDLSEAASQPMASNDGSLQLIYNGEIYNHADIRKELESLGHKVWKTDHSDTEVILKAFEQWGIHCLQKFRGMFAFALWDEKRRQLWLVRDRIGVKPLYYSLGSGRVTFASEIKALLKVPDQRRELDEEGLFDYLSFLTVPAPKTLFKGIFKLPPATWMRIEADGKIEQQRYWDVWDHTSPFTNVSEEQIAEMLLHELREAVRLRRVSDVPVGVFLSGGIDSSTNAALFSAGEKCKVQTFSIGYEGDHQTYQNELHYARQVADFVGAEYHERLLTQDDVINFLPQMVRLQDEPIGDPVCVPVYYVSKLARDNGVIVCQVGEGADELFCGYPSWERWIKFQRYSKVPLGRTGMSVAASLIGLTSKGGGLMHERFIRGGSGTPVFWSGAEAFSDSQKKMLLSPGLRKRFKGHTSWETIKPTWETFRAKAWEPSSLNWMTYADLKLRLPELLLMRVDKMSMGVSLEGRVPFLDHKFVELAMSIPTEIKTKDGVPKYILKKAVRGVIPDNIIDRPKQGFGVPVHEWFMDRLGDLTKKELASFAEQTGILDSAALDSFLRHSQRGGQAWYLLNLALWWKEYLCP